MTTAIAKKQNGDSSVSFGTVVDNIFQNSLRHFFDDNFWNDRGSLASGWLPVNVRETEQHYEMDVVAPGCRKEDFNIRLEDNLLTISMDRKEKDRQQDEKTSWVRNEYLQPSFSRTFTLDETVDVNNINATYIDGILHLQLPKNEKAKKIARTVEIK